MTDRREQDRDPVSLPEVLDGVLRLPQDGAPAAETPLLVRYFAGALSAAERTTLERRLTRSAALRRQWLDVEEDVLRLRSLRWEEIAAEGELSPTRGEVARAWLEVLRGRMEAATRTGRLRLAESWGSVRAEAADGLAEAQVTWTAFRSFFRRLVEGPTPALSPIRGAGSGTPDKIAGLPPGVTAGLDRWEIDPSGSLRLSLSLAGEAQALASLEGIPVRIGLSGDRETWPLADGHVASGRIEWVLPEASSLLGFPPGPLAPSWLSLAFGEPAGPAPRYLPVFAATDSTSRPTAPVYLELQGEPEWSAGFLRLRVRVPTAARSLYGHYRLRAELWIAEDIAQFLGEWRLDEGEPGGPASGELRIPCPGCPDGRLALPSLLRFSLHGPEGDLPT